MITNFLGDREFFKTFLKLAIPATIQYFISASLNLVDNIMVGQLGEIELAAVGLANQVYFLLILFILGVSSGASIFSAQFWGTKNITNIRRVLGLSLLISLTTACLFFIVSFAFSRPILGLFSRDPRVIELGGKYLAIVSFTYMMTAATSCYAAVLRSTGEVKFPTMVNATAFGLNTLLNYILIFGVLGFPQLGVTGAAIATVIARLAELLLLLGISYKNNNIIAANWSELTDISAELTKRFLSVTVTVVIKDLIWAFGTTLYMVIYARMGTPVVAAINIVTTIQRLANVLFSGIASACLVMVGNQIGRNQLTQAFLDAKRFLTITILVGVIIGGLTLMGRNLLLAPYNISDQVFQMSQSILLVLACFTPIFVFNMVAVVGVLRSGGDNYFCLIMDLTAIYFIGMPLAYLGLTVWNLSVTGVYTLIALPELFKFFRCLKRFITKRWLNNLVNDFCVTESRVN